MEKAVIENKLQKGTTQQVSGCYKKVSILILCFK
jgi:hypothetical protein